MKIRRIIPLRIRNIFRRMVGKPIKVRRYHWGSPGSRLHPGQNIWEMAQPQPDIWGDRRQEAFARAAAFNQFVHHQENKQVNVYEGTPDELNLDIGNWEPREAVEKVVKQKAETRVTQLTNLAQDSAASPAEVRTAKSMARKIADTYSIQIPKELLD